MNDSLQYALVTSSALPQQIGESRFYQELDKTQWLDLIDYSEELVETDKDQEILFLIVAKGTSDQIEEDENRRQQKEADKKRLVAEHEGLSDTLSVVEREKAQLKQELEEMRQALSEKTTELSSILDKELSEEEQERERLSAEATRQKSLRKRSVSLFNALYQK